jgi:hypothetical protein
MLVSPSTGEGPGSSLSFQMQRYLEQSPLEEPYIPRLVPIRTRRQHLQATLADVSTKFDNQSTPWIEEFSHTSLRSGDVRGEQRQLNQEKDEAGEENSGVGQTHAITPETWELIRATSAAPSYLSAVFESPTEVVTAKDGELFILDRHRKVKYLLSLTAALTIGFDLLRSLSGMKRALLISSTNLQVVPPWLPDRDKLCELIFHELSRRAPTSVFIQNEARSPRFNSSRHGIRHLVLDSPSCSSGKTCSSASGSEPSCKKQKTLTGVSLVPISFSPTADGQSGPSVAIGTLGKFRFDAKIWCGCFFCKMDPETHGEQCSRMSVRYLRTLTRPDRHMGLHIKRGDITTQAVARIFSKAFNKALEALEASDDDERLIRAWRSSFVRLFPVYVRLPLLRMITNL